MCSLTIYDLVRFHLVSPHAVFQSGREEYKLGEENGKTWGGVRNRKRKRVGTIFGGREGGKEGGMG